MRKSLLCKGDVDFLLVLAENERYLTYLQMVDIQFAKWKKVYPIADEKEEKKRIYDNFRKAKGRIEEKQKLTKRKYFLEDKHSKMFRISPEAVEKPRTCVILIEFIVALRVGTREVTKGNFEQNVSAKYRTSAETEEWTSNFVRDRLEDARQSGYISFNEARNEYNAESRLTTDEGLIVGIVKVFFNDEKTDKETVSKLKILLENFA